MKESTELSLREATEADARLYFGWANEAETRRQSLSVAPISWDAHRKWFEGKLADPDCRLFVLVRGGVPAGQVRFDLRGEEAVISYSVDKNFRGQGLGGKMLLMGIGRLKAERGGAIRRISGVVKLGNKASIHIFEQLGFRKRAEKTLDGEAVAGYVLEC